jgi:hypothetical protein
MPLQTLLTASGNSSLPSAPAGPEPFAHELASLISAVPGVPHDAIPGVLGRVEALRAALWAKLHAPMPPMSVEAATKLDDDRLLGPEEAGRRMGVTVRWLYRHYARLDFARKLSRKTLRFSERGLVRWLSEQAKNGGPEMSMGRDMKAGMGRPRRPRWAK